MKKLLAALAIASATCAVPAFAGVGVSISIGEPGFYGQLDIGNYDRPRIINNRPVVITQRYRNLAPVYLRVPQGEQRNWNRYCGRYDACYRPVYFVRDEWYRDVYSPRYRQSHQNNRRDDRRDDRGDHGRDNRHDDQRDNGRDNGRHDGDSHRDGQRGNQGNQGNSHRDEDHRGDRNDGPGRH